MNQTIESAAPLHRGADTKTRILDAAERLFAESGFNATSLREITREAQVNLAAVNYHFQNKESLILAVLSRKLAPIEKRRLEMLDEIERASGDGPLDLDAVLRALIAPVLEMRSVDGHRRVFPKLIGRLYTEPGDYFPQLVGRAFSRVLERFLPAFHRALPGMTRGEMAWGLHFGIGSMAHLLAAIPLLEFISGGEADTGNPEEAMELLLTYTAAGMRALYERKQAQ
jgi:AcrR family transcriptional regulator